MTHTQSEFETGVQVLNQLFAAQSILHIFPDPEKMGEFAVQALKNIPEIEKCCIYLNDRHKPIGDTFDAGEKLSEMLMNNLNGLPVSSVQLPKEENLAIFSLQTVDIFFGYLLLKVKNKEVYQFYEPAASNFVNIVAIYLENSKQRESMTNHQIQLEDKIKERTFELQREVEQRKKTDENFQDLYENASEMFVSVDPATSIVLQCNQTLCKKTGFSKAEIIGRSIFERYDPVCLEEVKKVFLQFQETGEIHNQELKIKHKNGKSLDVLLNVTSVKDEKNQILYSRSSWQDINELTILKKSEQKSMDNAHRLLELANNSRRVLLSVVEDEQKVREQLKELNEQLEHRVIERTSQLLQANNELESFSYSISHDLRAPLRAIYGFSQILATRHRESLNDEGKNYMDYVVDASIRMEQLINDLLNYSRLGRKSIALHPVSLKSICDAVYSDFQIELDKIGGTLKLNTDLPTIQGDESLLRQIFSNLVGNAIKYRRPNISLEINIESEQIKEGYLIKIIDNGIGISEKHYEKIFNVFQRLHSEAKYPGTGIGLANVKKAITIHGGTITLESKVDSGSTFIIKFTEPQS